MQSCFLPKTATSERDGGFFFGVINNPKLKIWQFRAFLYLRYSLKKYQMAKDQTTPNGIKVIDFKIEAYAEKIKNPNYDPNKHARKENPESILDQPGFPEYEPEFLKQTNFVINGSIVNDSINLERAASQIIRRL